MAYQANIPQPNNLLSQSQDDILNNFQAIQTLIGVNHVNFGASDQGKHKWITFPIQAAIPPSGSGFNAGELGLYNAVNTTTTQSELYINKTNQATVVQVPMTASILSYNSAPPANFGGWTYLPSGLLLYFGSYSAVTGSFTVTLSGPPTVPVATQLIQVLVCPYSTTAGDVNTAVRLQQIISGTQFSVYISNRTTVGPATGGFQFLAIGY